jgi:hypothetical protein
MAATPKKLYRGTLGTTSSTLYTVPTNTTAIIKHLAIANTSASAVTVTLSFGGVTYVNALSIAPNTVQNVDLTMIMSASESITASAGTTSAATLHISGVEVA